MATKDKNILALSTNDAFDFLMKSELFRGFVRPKYFDFNEVLDSVHQILADCTYGARLCFIVLGDGLTLLNKHRPAPKRIAPFPQQFIVN